MDYSNRSKQLNRKRSKETLDRKVDQWIETGRQVVDGFSGTRPGRRRSFMTDRLAPPSLDDVGRWVGDKLDWFLEDEDGWLEPWQSNEEINSFSKKKPLEAISRRVSNPRMNNQKIRRDDEWPDESSFRLDRWKRSNRQKESGDDQDSDPLPKRRRDVMRPSSQRPLPRSNRKRD